MIEWIDKQIIVTVVLFLTVLWLNIERRKLKGDMSYHLDALRQQMVALRDDFESLPGTANGLQYWESVRAKWADARDRIEAVIDGLDGRVRRKYGRMTRYSYADIIAKLQEDEALTTSSATALSDMNRLFMQAKRNPQAITLQRSQEFAVLFDRAIRDLPTQEE